MSASLKRKHLYSNKDELIKSMLNYLHLYRDNKLFEVPKYDFFEEVILIDEIDYYHSNPIARASKTMNECKNVKADIKKTGTNG